MVNFLILDFLRGCPSVRVENELGFFALIFQPVAKVGLNLPTWMQVNFFLEVRIKYQLFHIFNGPIGYSPDAQ
ncbi:hypothetical protein D3C72_2547010 [compost metagenome]